MTNYLLSIDPSMKNTGFTLGEKECEVNSKYLGKPIGINSYNFKNYKYENYMELIHTIILNKVNGLYGEQLSLCIEQGFINKGKGKETLEHLRGFIAGGFNKLITKDMLVHNLTGKKGYKNRPFGAYGDIKNEKGTKETSLAMAQIIISENEGDFNITNHDEADSLLIGGYYLNKEV